AGESGGEFVATYRNTQFYGTPQGTLNAQVGLLGAGNSHGLPAGTVVLSYGQTQDPAACCPDPMDGGIGLNAGNGNDFATLHSLGIGQANGSVLASELASAGNSNGFPQGVLPGRTFAFEYTPGQTIITSTGAGFASSPYSAMSTY